MVEKVPTDTFKLYAMLLLTLQTLPTLKNIENVVNYNDNARSRTVDLTKWDTVETLFLVGADTTQVMV